MSMVIPGRHNVSECGERAFEKRRVSFRISTWEACRSGTQILHRARERYGPAKVEKGWQPLGRNAGSCLKMAADGTALFLKTLRAPPNLNLVPIIISATVSVAEKVFTQSHQVCVIWNSSPRALGQDPQHGPISTTICLCEPQQGEQLSCVLCIPSFNSVYTARTCMIQWHLPRIS